MVYTWPEVVEDIDQRGNRDRADKRVYKYPVELFGTYKSAELHTRKKYTPRRVKQAFVWFGVAAVALGFAVWKISGFWKHDASHPVPVASAPAESSHGYSPFSGDGKRRDPKTMKEFLDEQKPRIAGVMWSAPIFDDRKAEAQPETYCMAMQGGPCKCITEQGTSAVMPDRQCRDMARYGLYNPYKRPVEDERFADTLHRRTERSENPAALGESPESDAHALGSQWAANGKQSGKQHAPLSQGYNADVFAKRTTQY